jgi:uncharacterized protein (UPF0332 family)
MDFIKDLILVNKLLIKNKLLFIKKKNVKCFVGVLKLFLLHYSNFGRLDKIEFAPYKK